jgi:hypothetical protein
MLIPDLQRPYVWTPNQVTLLLDSLIRGWPFGTLLLWKVNHQELHGIPFRPFWTVVDKTKESNGAQVTQMNPPAEYHMVLDGQQRVQSLLLALGGDDWGFTLEDRDWTEEIKDRRPRGRQAKYQHWSKASLCFDLVRFTEEYAKESNNLLAVDFSKVLVWVITDPQAGQSNFPKPDNYEDPLPKAYATENQKRFIRLSRLWREAQPNPGLKEAQFRQILRPLLEQHSVAEETIAKLLPPMGELMTTLRDVKLADVTFLELQPFDSQTWTPDTYNDAIVSIFTRLNTAGRTLTREEITLAWLKVGWKTELTGEKSAGDCFSELGTDLGEDELNLELDALVSTASFLWSVSHNEGRLLANSDLLKGDVIRPMASALSQRWKPIRDAFANGAKVLAQRGFDYGPRGHFSSLYELAVLCAWLYVAEIWKADHALGVLAKDNFEKKCNNSISKHLDRWIMCSQWAGVWSGASITTIEAYVKTLAELLKNVSLLSNPEEVHKAWDECFEKFVDDLTPGATNYVNSLSAPGRDRVGIYRNLLWVWHRLDEDRWETSQIQLRVGKKKPTSEVDHIVSFSLWKNKLASASQGDLGDQDETIALANRLGNCALLEKNFNISKGDKTLKSFLSQIHEVKEKKIRIDAWCAALAIPQPLLDPGAVSVDDISEAIDNRDKEIRLDLAEFVRGQKVREDLNTPGTQSKPSTTIGVPTTDTSVDTADAHAGTDEPDPSAQPADTRNQELAPSPDGEVALHTAVDLAGLRSAYSDDVSVKLILDHFAARQRNQNVTEIETLVDVLNRAGTPSSRSVVIRVFRSLDALGVGRFIPGRKGHATRFEWHEKSLSLRGHAATNNT